MSRGSERIRGWKIIVKIEKSENSHRAAVAIDYHEFTNIRSIRFDKGDRHAGQRDVVVTWCQALNGCYTRETINSASDVTQSTLDVDVSVTTCVLSKTYCIIRT